MTDELTTTTTATSSAGGPGEQHAYDALGRLSGTRNSWDGMEPDYTSPTGWVSRIQHLGATEAVERITHSLYDDAGEMEEPGEY